LTAGSGTIQEMLRYSTMKNEVVNVMVSAYGKGIAKQGMQVREYSFLVSVSAYIKIRTQYIPRVVTGLNRKVLSPLSTYDIRIYAEIYLKPNEPGAQLHRKIYRC